MSQTANEHLFTQLAATIASGIASGSYRRGERLPSLRRLQQARGVSLATAYRAYEDLEARGLIEVRPRSGFFVSSAPPQRGAPPRLSGRPIGPRPVTVAAAASDVIAASLDPSLVPFGASTLCSEWLPTRHMARILRDLLASELEAVLNYAPSEGDPELRRALAGRSVLWGAPVAVDQIVVTAGCAEAVSLALRAVAPAGSPVVVESPTHFGFLQILRELGHPALALPTDPTRGLEPAALREALARHKVGACLLTPHFQNPLGFLMPDERKQEIVELTNRHAVPLIEDDIYGDLSFAAKRPTLMRRYDLRGLVTTCSSVSKVLAPGFRVGWCIPGERHVSRVLRLKAATTLASATLAQKATQRFLGTGAFDRHLRHLREQLRIATGRMAESLSHSFPEEVRFVAPPGGNMFWVELPAGVDAMRLSRRAREAGISIVPGNVFSPGSAYASHVRLTCTRPFDDRMAAGIATLGKLIRAQR